MEGTSVIVIKMADEVVPKIFLEVVMYGRCGEGEIYDWQCVP